MMSPLDPDLVITDWGVMLNQYRFNTIPPLSMAQIERIKYAWFLYYKFFQDNGLTNRLLVQNPEDIETLVVKARDFTTTGEEIYRFRRTEERYSSALDRGTSPEIAVKNILERSLKRSASPRHEIKR
jgi:hypothetical protein